MIFNTDLDIWSVSVISYMVKHCLFSISVLSQSLLTSTGQSKHGAFFSEKSPIQNFTDCFLHVQSVTAYFPYTVQIFCVFPVAFLPFLKQ